MRFTNLFKTKAKPALDKLKEVIGLTDFTERKMETFFKTHHLSELQKIVAPFETEIPLHLVKQRDGNTLVISVEPIPGIEFERNNALPDPGTFETAALFFILNDGTNTRHAFMPPDFKRESHPGSLATNSSDYMRDGILVSKKFHYDIEPRDWLTLVEAKYADAFEKEFSHTTQSFFKSLLSRIK